MKIRRIDIPDSYTEPHGLKKIRMERLADIVLIAGKNGSGKSRLLKIISNLCNSHQTDAVLANMQESKNRHEEVLHREPQNPNVALWRGQLEKLNRQLEFHHYLGIDGHFLPEKILYFLPKQLELRDPAELRKRDLRDTAKAVELPGVDNMQGNVLPYIQFTLDRFWNVTHQDYPVDDPERASAIRNYDRLSEIIERLLRTKLGRNANGDATLFDFALGDSRLSDGQKILLQLCVAIHAQGVKIAEMVLLLDEPENHLHPSVLLEVIDSIRSCLTDGQLIIATHSINLLAHYDPCGIWYMESGDLRYAGKIPQTVLAGLIGDEEEMSRLSNFLSLPAQSATLRFAAESLFPPIPVSAQRGDPQTNQIYTELSRRGGPSPIRLLDFGAGKGRLISALAEAMEGSGKSLAECLDYRAFDVDSDFVTDCKNEITTFYGADVKRYFQSGSELLESFNESSFDVVVMCNVLHEIDPKEWLKIFNADALIPKLLKNDGVLLLVEDQYLPRGEKAYKHGFLVLDTLELKALFAISEQEAEFEAKDARGDGRLKLHKITRAMLTRVTDQTRRQAILRLRDHAKEQILQIRKKVADFKNGQLHGFWAQQFTNASLVLDELGD